MRVSFGSFALTALAAFGQAAPFVWQGAADLLSPPVAQLRLNELDEPESSKYRPVAIWHGLGDDCNSDGMLTIKGDLERRYPGISVLNLCVSKDDRKAGFFGNVNEQIERVADLIEAMPTFDHGYDAIGFSQGGQFLRGLIELRGAPIRNLITFGGQHMGISDLPECSPKDLLCKLARSAAFRGVYSRYAQTSLVQAQYFRDQERLDLYRESNTFLAIINNEIESKDASYKDNLRSLSNFVMLQFSNETTVVPAVSSHFGSLRPLPVDATGGKPAHKVIPLRGSQLYLEDWIGLKALDEAGKLHFGWCDGEHMQFSLDDNGGCWDKAVRRWIGSKAGVVE